MKSYIDQQDTQQKQSVSNRNEMRETHAHEQPPHTSKKKKRNKEMPAGIKVCIFITVAVVAVLTIVFLTKEIAGFDTLQEMFDFIRDSIATG